MQLSAEHELEIGLEQYIETQGGFRQVGGQHAAEAGSRSRHNPAMPGRIPPAIPGFPLIVGYSHLHSTASIQYIATLKMALCSSEVAWTK